MKPIRIDSEAEAELAESVDYYEKQSPGLGLEFEEMARSAVFTIQRDPTRFPQSSDGTRHLVMKRFPYIIHFLEIEESILILGFAHTSRRPRYWRDRLD